MITGTLSRYFGMRFLTSVVGSFIGVVALAAMIDYVELMRRGADWPNATAWVLAKISMYRVPQLTERIMPFSVLVGAMSCYLGLSRRLELVVARAAGVSAWQFVAPAMIAAFLFGTVATTIYNPVSASLHERSKRLEADMLGENLSALQGSTSGFWVRQKSADGAAIIKAATRARSSAASASIPSIMPAIFSSASKPKAPRCNQAIGCLRTRASTPAAKRRILRVLISSAAI
jgi:lipopolysaccharide export system permease protein